MAGRLAGISAGGRERAANNNPRRTSTGALRLRTAAGPLANEETWWPSYRILIPNQRKYRPVPRADSCEFGTPFRTTYVCHTNPRLTAQAAPSQTARISRSVLFASKITRTWPTRNSCRWSSMARLRGRLTRARRPPRAPRPSGRDPSGRRRRAARRRRRGRSGRGKAPLARPFVCATCVAPRLFV